MNVGKDIISDEFMNTPITITPKKLAGAISRAANKSTAGAPPHIRDSIVKTMLKFGATIMTELLYVDLGLDPIEETLKEDAKEGEKEEEASESKEESDGNGEV